MAEKRHTMRDSSSIAAPLLLVCLLTWRCCHGAEAGSDTGGIGHGPAGPLCASEYVAVADTTSFPIAGCYRKTTEHSLGNDFSYANYDGRVVEGRASQPMVVWNLQDGWGIGVSGDPLSTVCTFEPGTGAGGWECSDGAILDDLVTCGCSASEQLTSDRLHTAWVDAHNGGVNGGVNEGGGVVAGSSGSGGGRNGVRGRGADSRDTGVGVARVAGAGGGPAGVSRVLASGEFHSFWMWVIIAGGIAGLIVLCCIGWYIRNPFFCQKAPPTDPNAQVEDAAPQAPKTAFQPWGASAPPK